MYFYIISQTVDQLRRTFRSGRTKSLEWRRSQLEAFLRLFDEHTDDLCDAVKKDLNKVNLRLILCENGEVAVSG